MTEDFFLRALAGGIGVALASGPVGCFVVWRRMAYFGAALAHAVLLGVALGFLLEIEPTLAIFVMCLLLAGCLTLLERQRLVPLDTLLGVLAHGIFAAGLVVIAFMEQVRVDLMGYLLGDILSVSAVDLWFIYAIAAGSVAALAWQWRNLLAMTVNEDLAAVEGVPVGRMRILLVVLLAVVIAIGMKIVGMLLVLALVIIPAATARRIVTTPEQMVAAAAAIGAAAAAGGLFGSLEWDVPAGPAIVLVASAMFVASLLVPARGTFRSWRVIDSASPGGARDPSRYDSGPSLKIRRPVLKRGEPPPPSSTGFRQRPGIVDVQVFGRLRSGSHHLDAVLRDEPVPAALRHHQQHAGGKLVRLDLVADDDVQAGRALDNLHDLVALQVPLPAAGAAEARGEEAAVTEIAQ